MALAEYFQDDSGAGVQPIDTRHHSPNMTVFALADELVLLDLDSGWVTRAGGNQAIRTGRRHRSRLWARAIYRHHGNRVHGVAYGSSVWGPGRCIALWETAIAALPKKPAATRPLSDPGLAPPIAKAASLLNTYPL